MIRRRTSELMTARLVIGVALGGVAATGCVYGAPEPPLEEVAPESSALDRAPATPPLAPDQCGPWRPALIDDLEDGDVLVGRDDGGTWLLFNDQTGTQLPAVAEGLVVRGGPRGSRFAAHSSGDGFSAWGAGFGVALGCGYDVRKFDGVRFKVKAGGARRFRVEVPTLGLLGTEFGGRCESNCQDFYSAPLEVGDDGWYECTVPFARLSQVGWGTVAPLDLTTVTGLQFNFALENVPYDLWVDDLELAKHSRLGCVSLRSSCR
jgi:hypothetical protein